MAPEPLFYVFHFYLFGVIAVASAIAFVTRKSPVAAALWLVTTMFALAAMYIMLGAQFIGAVQVIVYAGAIMVVFLFVIMLLNLGQPEELADVRGLGWRLAAGGVGLAMVAMLLTLTRTTLPEGLLVPGARSRPLVEAEPLAGVAGPMFSVGGFLLAFEVASVLLLAAIVGAVVLAKRRTPDAG